MSKLMDTIQTLGIRLRYTVTNRRSVFTKTARAALIKSGYSDQYAVQLEGPHAHELPGCAHMTDFRGSQAEALRDAIRFCDSKGIRITKLTVGRN